VRVRLPLLRRRQNLKPALIEHATSPLVGEGERFGTSWTAFSEQDLTIDENTQFPICRPRQEGASGHASKTPHRPQRTDVIWRVSKCLSCLPCVHGAPQVQADTRDRSRAT